MKRILTVVTAVLMGCSLLWSMNTADIQGIESERLNPAGLAFTNKTEIGASYTLWLQGSGIGVAHFGICQKLKDNAIALSFQALNIGSIVKTTTADPEGTGSGSYTPFFVNIAASYARKFSNSISAGVNFRFIDEGFANINAAGFCVDGGLQYVTGPKDNIHFGVSLRNVGTPMVFKGDALTTTTEIISTSTYELTVANRVNQFELPTQLNIGAAYDVWMGRKKEIQPKVFKQDFRLTAVANFVSNAFGYDYYGVGVEFGWKEILMLRTAYRFEQGMFNPATRLDAYTGLACGFTIDAPFKKDGGPHLAIDYSFRSTSPFQGTHSLGLRFNL